MSIVQACDSKLNEIVDTLEGSEWDREKLVAEKKCYWMNIFRKIACLCNGCGVRSSIVSVKSTCHSYLSCLATRMDIVEPVQYMTDGRE